MCTTENALTCHLVRSDGYPGDVFLTRPNANPPEVSEDPAPAAERRRPAPSAARPAPERTAGSPTPRRPADPAQASTPTTRQPAQSKPVRPPAATKRPCRTPSNRGRKPQPSPPSDRSSVRPSQRFAVPFVLAKWNGVQPRSSSATTSFMISSTGAWASRCAPCSAMNNRVRERRPTRRRRPVTPVRALLAREQSNKSL